MLEVGDWVRPDPESWWHNQVKVGQVVMVYLNPVRYTVLWDTGLKHYHAEFTSGSLRTRVLVKVDPQQAALLQLGCLD